MGGSQTSVCVGVVLVYVFENAKCRRSNVKSQPCRHCSYRSHTVLSLTFSNGVRYAVLLMLDYYRITVLLSSFFHYPSLSRSHAPPPARRAWLRYTLLCDLRLFTFVASINFRPLQLSHLLILSPQKPPPLPHEKKSRRWWAGERRKRKERLRLGRSLTVVFRHLICYKVNVGALSMPKAPTTKSEYGTESSPLFPIPPAPQPTTSVSSSGPRSGRAQQHIY